MFSVIDVAPPTIFSSDWRPFVGGFNICRDSPVITLAAIALFIGLSLAFAIAGGGKWDLNTFQVYLAQAMMVPIAIAATLWCYAHPEQLDGNPDSWMSDMRIYWPFFAIGELIFILYWFKETPKQRLFKALDLLHPAFLKTLLEA